MAQTEIATEKNLYVSLTLHNFPVEMIKEFAQRIVKPYFSGNINNALRKLMENAIAEETIISEAIRKEKRHTSNDFRSS
jgi:hypothetical protein